MSEKIKEQDRQNKMFRNIHMKFLSAVYDRKIFVSFFVSYIRVVNSLRIKWSLKKVLIFVRNTHVSPLQSPI